MELEESEDEEYANYSIDDSDTSASLEYPSTVAYTSDEYMTDQTIPTDSQTDRNSSLLTTSSTTHSPPPYSRRTTIITTTTTTTTLSPTTQSSITANFGGYKNIATSKIPKKPIQIIIPYSTYKKPEPFKIQEEYDDLATIPDQITTTEVPKTTSLREGETIKYVETTDNIKDILKKETEQPDSKETIIVTPDFISTTRLMQKPKGKGRELYNLITVPLYSTTMTAETTITTTTRPPKTRPTSTTPIPKTRLTSTRAIPQTRPTTTTSMPIYKRKEPMRLDHTELQRKIDIWTEEEFAVDDFTSKASTMSLVRRTKAIPAEYLTTTMMPSFMNFVSDRSKLNSKQSWNKLKVAISPVTKEKVYVVTPQPWSPFIYDNIKPVSSPRFAVRPTPLYYRNRGSALSRVSPESGKIRNGFYFTL